MFCNDKMTLLKLQLRKINSGNTALGEAVSLKMSSNKNINYQPDVNGSDRFHYREHTDPKPSLSRVTLLRVQNLSIATSPQLLLSFKLQSIQTLRFCYYTDNTVLCFCCVECSN